MKNILYSALILTASVALAEPPEIPEGPLLADAAPVYSRWTVTCTYSEARKEEDLSAEYKAAMMKIAEEDPVAARLLKQKPEMLQRKPRLIQRVINKSDDTRTELLTYSNGKKGETWQNSKVAVTRDAFTDAFSVRVTEGEAFGDFLEFAWVKKDNFKEVTSVRGKKCMVFRSVVQLKQIEDPKAYAVEGGLDGEESNVTATAMIDLETRMPVSLQFNDQTWNYAISETPKTTLTIPGEFKAVLVDVEKRMLARRVALPAP